MFPEGIGPEPPMSAVCMSRIRINELARELEVKPHIIIETLPEVGVAEKKTHSSSIEKEEADKVRLYLKGVVRERPATEPSTDYTEVSVEPEEEVQAEPERPASQPIPQASPVIPVLERFEGATTGISEPVETPAPESVVKTPIESVVRRAPLRPPLAGGRIGSPPPVAPPPASHVAQPVSPPVAQAPAPPVIQAPPIPVAPPVAKTVAVPARPVPPPRPGQILSGPRQPLPPSPSEPSAEAVMHPGQPLKPMPAQPRPPQPPRRPERPQPPAAVAAPQRPKPPLAGQPAARPVVPPRPDLVARLTQQAKMPGQPQPPRPGQPRPGMFRTQATPVPGQPIYRGPIRPGQPIVRGPGPQPGRRREPGMPPVPEMEPTPSPTAPQRRHQAKPARPVGRERERDREGALRGPVYRRQEPEEVRATNRDITISEGITVKELSEKLGVKAGLVIKKLVERKIFATINQTLDVKLAEDLARASAPPPTR